MRAPALNVISPLYRNNRALRDAARLSDADGTQRGFRLQLRNRLELGLDRADIGGLNNPRERWQGERKPVMGLTVKQRF